MLLSNIELTIRVKGRPIIEYRHNGQTFVEGRPGSEYEIELHNQTFGRVEAILSVDGLSIIDGQPAGTQSRGYLINARDSLRIPGWTLNNAAVAKFAFAAQQSSYAAQSGQDTRNVGVIGAMVFQERQAIPVLNTATYNDWFLRSLPAGVTLSSNSMSNPSLQSQAIYTQNMVSPQNMASASPEAAGGSLGTAFGSAQTFATKQVQFERAGLLATLLCYYDDRRGLRARGINLTRYTPQPAPQAFPATGCRPPPNWNG